MSGSKIVDPPVQYEFFYHFERERERERESTSEIAEQHATWCAPADVCDMAVSNNNHIKTLKAMKYNFEN